MTSKTDKSYRIVGIEARHVLGIEEMKMDPGGNITVIEAPNGVGKSSFLKALKTALGSGVGLANIQRIDRETGEPTGKPEVVLVLEDEEGRQYRVARDEGGVAVSAQVPGQKGMKTVPAPVSWLRTIYDGQGADPTVFLEAAPKDQTLMLLESLPITFHLDAFLGKIGMPKSVRLPPIPIRAHPLEIVALVRDEVFTTRRGVNSSAKAKRSAAEETISTIPQEWVDPEGDGTIAKLEEERSALEGEVGGVEKAAAATADAAIRAAEIARQEATAAAQRAHDMTIAAAERAREVAMAEAKTVYGDEVARIVQERQEAVSVAHEAKTRLAVVRVRIDQERAGAETAAGYRALGAQAEAFNTEAEKLEEESKLLTACLDRLAAARAELAKDIPIAGVDVRDGQVYVDGIPFAQVNTERRVDVAVGVACLRAKGLPLVCVDDLEHLDDAHKEALFENLRARGVQAIMAGVSARGSKLKVWKE